MTEIMHPGQVIPAFVDGGSWSACFGLSWTDLMLADQAHYGRIVCQGGQYLRNVAGTGGVAAARNTIAENFLNTGAEWLFMVDTDMGFPSDIVERLVASAEANKALVVGALAFAQKAAQLPETSLHARRLKLVPTLYDYVELGDEKGFRPRSIYVRDAFQWVDGTGAASLRIHRDALTAVGPDPFRPILVPNALPGGRAREFSEDLSFCARLANVGVAIGVDTSVKTTHHKGGIFLDEETYTAQEVMRMSSPIGVRTGATV
jgi:hypothetical protein